LVKLISNIVVCIPKCGFINTLKIINARCGPNMLKQDCLDKYKESGRINIIGLNQNGAKKIYLIQFGA
jgi:hypothetical protein